MRNVDEKIIDALIAGRNVDIEITAGDSNTSDALALWRKVHEVLHEDSWRKRSAAAKEEQIDRSVARLLAVRSIRKPYHTRAGPSVAAHLSLGRPLVIVILAVIIMGGAVFLWGTVSTRSEFDARTLATRPHRLDALGTETSDEPVSEPSPTKGVPPLSVLISNAKPGATLVVDSGRIDDPTTITKPLRLIVNRKG